MEAVFVPKSRNVYNIMQKGLIFLLAVFVLYLIYSAIRQGRYDYLKYLAFCLLLLPLFIIFADNLARKVTVSKNLLISESGSLLGTRLVQKIDLGKSKTVSLKRKFWRYGYFSVLSFKSGDSIEEVGLAAFDDAEVSGILSSLKENTDVKEDKI